MSPPSFFSFILLQFSLPSVRHWVEAHGQQSLLPRGIAVVAAAHRAEEQVDLIVLLLVLDFPTSQVITDRVVRFPGGGALLKLFSVPQQELLHLARVLQPHEDFGVLLV